MLHPQENFPFQHYGHPYLASEHIQSDMGHMMRIRFITSVEFSYRMTSKHGTSSESASLGEAPHDQIVAWRALSINYQMPESMHVEFWSKVPFANTPKSSTRCEGLQSLTPPIQKLALV